MEVHTVASSAPKKTTAANKKTSAAKGGSSRSKKTPQKRPIRREVGGAVLLVLALFVGVSYFQTEGWFIAFLPRVCKGLLGWGYYLTAPALAAAAVILLTHRGRPVIGRTVCALLTPVALGSLCHVLLCKLDFESSVGIIPRMWRSGIEGTSGGVLSGILAHSLRAAFGNIATIVLFTVLLVCLLAVVFHRGLTQLWSRWSQREHLDYEEEEETEPRIRVVEKAPPRRREADRPKPQIDFPLDDEPPAAEPEKPSRVTGFFRHKSDQQRTPDQVLRPVTPAIPDPEPPVQRPVKKAEPVVQEPAPAPAPVPVQAPVSEEPPAPRKEKTANEVAAQTAAVTAEIEEKLAGEEEVYQFPPITLLKAGGSGNHMEAGAELRNNSRRLAETLTSFGVDATPGDVVHGPSVTRYEFVLEQGVKLSKITNLADDIALALGATGVRIAPIPDKISVVGIEVPNKQVTPVLIRDVIESREFTEHKSQTAFAVGRDIGGRNIVGNIEKLPHVLIAGTTGSGKSVCTNSLIISLLYKSTPDEVRFIMVDPKMVELAPYNGIPHLLIPVVTDPKKAAGALQWAVFEMMKRYKTFSEHGVKKLEEYNKLARTREDLETMPSVVVVIDELADLMLVAAKEVEESICRVAQMGRAAGMHLVIATQRPSADVITGLMKANIPSRIAFAVASSLESRIILDTTGAEKLVGKGDMLYAPLGESKIRVQGCFITPEEIEDVVSFVKQSGEAQYSDEVIAKIEESMQEKEKGSKGGGGAAADLSGADEGDELFPAAVEVVLETGQASVSMLQRRLKLGYSRAARLVDQMEERGVVGPFEGSKPRQLLITKAQWQEMQLGGAPAEGEEPPFPVEE